MKSIHFFDCNFSDLPIDRKELFLLMGYGEHIPNDEMLDLIEGMLNEVKNFCNPRCGYVLLEGEVISREEVKVGDVVLKPGRIITSAIRNADYYALFSATAGAGFDKWLEKLKEEDDIIKIFIADALGSVIAEETVSLLMKDLEKDAEAEGLHISNNYSPGYCDWLLVDQKKLFSLFPDGITGIKLTESCLMLPVKSVSGIVGVGKSIRKKAYSCEICGMTTCIKNKKRKAKETKV